MILRAFAADFNSFVEPLRDADSACWTLTNSVGTSNHLSGTACDFNWGSHPFEVSYAGFDQAKIATMRALLDFYEGTVFWGQDWISPKDPMHVQMNGDTYNSPRTGDFIARKIRSDGFSTFRRGPLSPADPPHAAADPAAPQPIADDGTDSPTKVLYDAVPVIDMTRAGQLVDAMAAGLALAECTNVNRIAMFLAQTGEESDGFNTTQEYGTGQRYAPYIGRTWIQITWQANYALFGQWAADQGLIDDPNYFVNNPAALADLKWAGIGAAWYWVVARPTINNLCDQGDIVGVTQLINGGQNGITDRRARYQQAIALGDRLLLLIAPKGPLMALSDAQQQQLLDAVLDIQTQLRGPGLTGWPELGQRADGNGTRTPVDALAHLAGNKDA